ncbi:hypothetical protein A3D80_04245 [Candidatus Roizmanbacteria bacterium RIFCSPHIGHO2_02_FULL_40_13b]|uniref:PDZ domain-containing protein n=1 Tax=Candidatus Roizmanbacteria bacterium RIFCSPHIGHO2_01_FULL_39_24 TaxID=1802032 RepID=A0A1F7GE92_9BACT|nr:MAG: hypothetical protein A2799_03455 [Candidatus Roizmanbacteria bacterium RIFCSPHIGHO2_01_FULL_39_24]OGK27721.1 MAG: hypothetical protein A3D80_04245 [Candidatus Roizmanbacteria bacterium RIFCSPHIGHO2_02_FULL_40_13b]OGK49485.1 MAG: hypothetical protein A3A56_01935 [Candidatus Roizmanbacteria bacterium RIFCSPLOWO2_01_FULL_40_32]
MKIDKHTKYILGACLGVLLFGLGFKSGEYSALSSPLIKQDFSLYQDVWTTLSQKYVDQKKIVPKQMMYDSIKGMVSSVGDPYTFFLTPEENKNTKDDLGGKFEGIGAQLGLKDNKIVVIAPIKDSPAASAGILSGDIITAVDGVSTEKWTLPQAVSKIRGKGGTTVKLALLRSGKSLTMAIKRGEIKVPTIELSYKNKAAILKLSRFGDDTNSEWDKAVEIIAQKWGLPAGRQKIKGMVLDLRDNPGGYLQSAVYLASEFLPADVVIVKQVSIGKVDELYKSDRTGKLVGIPLSILINEGSASASEIVAGALSDYKKATLVGKKSFGKGSVQEAVDLKDGAGLHVTIAKWILPKGRWINKIGVKPDIEIDNKKNEGNTLEEKDDLQLAKAITIVIK